MDLREAIAAKMDAEFTSLFYGTGATRSLAPTPRAEDILESFRIALASVPPPPVFASSVEYPLAGFWQFERDGREYVIGHPDLWAKIPPRALDNGVANPLDSIPIRDADHPGEGELRGMIRLWMATASHVPGRPVQWPRGVEVAPSVRARVRPA